MSMIPENPAAFLAANRGRLRCRDISVLLGRESIDYPGDPPYVRERLASLAAGDPFELSALRLSAHCGTHLDAPAHLFERGPTIDTLPPERFILPAVVVDATGRPAVDVAALAGTELRPGEAVLFKTDNSLTGTCRSGVFREDYVSLARDAAALLVERKVALVGLDAVSVDAFEDTGYPVHVSLLGNGVLVLEGIDLAGVDAGRYLLVCLPLRILGGEASPVRAVLLS